MGEFGGALYLKCAKFTAEDAIFQNNTSGGNGGAILVDEVDGLSAQFTNCQFLNNTAGFNGVVYAFPNIDGGLTFTGCTFFGNSDFQGGAISAWQVAYLTVIGCDFEQNSIRIGGDGAAMYGTGYQPHTTVLYILHSTFHKNIGTAAPGSASVNAISCQCVGIMNSSFTDHLGVAVGIDDAFGICSSGTYPPLFNLSTIADNGQDFNDQYITQTILASTSVDIRNCTCSGNVDSTFLGSRESKVVATNLPGGAGLSILTTQYVVLVDLTFTDNKALEGGALLLDTSTYILVWRCIFTNNLATQGGGEIASVNNVHSPAGNLLIGQSVLSDNTASTGGGIYGADQASMVITNSTIISNNRAATNGGGISCEDCAAVTLQLQAAIGSNLAGASGGAVYCDSCTTYVSNDPQYTQNSRL